MFGPRQWNRCLVIGAAVVLASPAFAAADECLYRVGSWPFGPVSAVAVSGGIGYYGNGAALVVADLADPSRPAVLGHLEMPGPIGEIAVAGERAFVGTGERSLVIVDVSNPAVPVTIARVDLFDEVRRVAANETIAVVHTGQTVWAIDMTDPDEPGEPALVLGSMPHGLAVDLALTASHLFVATRAGDFEHPGLVVFDVSTPSAPGFVTRADLPLSSDHRIFGLAATGNALYLTEEDGLRVIDVTAPDAPVAVGRLVMAEARAIAVSGTHAYVACDCELVVVDVSAHSAPNPRGRLDLQSNIRDLAVDADTALIADDRSQLSVVDVSAADTPHQLAVVDVPGATSRVETAGRYAYLLEDGKGLRVLELSDPSAPVTASFVPIAETGADGYGWDLALADSRAYVLRDFSVVVFDLSSPAAPVLVGGLVDPHLGGAAGFAVSGDTVYVAADYGLVVIDATDPTSMEVVAWGGIAHAGSVAIDGAYACVGGSDEEGLGLYVLDLGHPTAPVKLGFVESQCDSWICGTPLVSHVADGQALMIDQGRLRIIDVSDPGAPFELGRLDTAGVSDVAVSGHHAYAVGDGPGALVVDLSDPTAPQAVARLSTAGTAQGVALSGRLVLVADGAAGLSVLRHTLCTSSVAPVGSPW